MNDQKIEYELVLLLFPSLSEADTEAYLEKFKKEILGNISGEVTFKDYWGVKTLAYPIQKETSAHYVVVRFTCLGDKIASLDEEIRLDKNVLRHLIVRVEKGMNQITSQEREAWNQENLPEKKKAKGPVEKRASKHTRKPKAAAPVKEKREEVKPTVHEKLDKDQLEKKLDEILDGDLNI